MVHQGLYIGSIAIKLGNEDICSPTVSISFRHRCWGIVRSIITTTSGPIFIPSPKGQEPCDYCAKIIFRSLVLSPPSESK